MGFRVWCSGLGGFGVEQAFGLGLGGELFELGLQRLVLGLFALEKAREDARLLLNALGREQVGGRSTRGA
ncbi:MAG: hypothetical protein VBE63_27875 [Lamprobacter sp.]|uniref:hypothetical protein n=1 Tax=Lamprobacter sp. TaxID=3100796 RepID=UPI002B25D2BB|nr:hypothetical protein [Lamprobacter sp.]MEA3643717.1 hypothetical protein [Lamprobacter sp.]